MFSFKSKLQIIANTKLPINKISRQKVQTILKMGSETPNSDEDWDYPLTEEDLRAIDSAFSAATASTAKRHAGDNAPVDSPPNSRRRRLPESLFVFQQQNNPSCSFSPCSRSRSYSTRTNADLSPFRGTIIPQSSLVHSAFEAASDVKFGGRIIYSRTTEEVERAAKELLDFVEAKKRKEGQCILGLDIEWRPSFRRGVAPGQTAVLQICGENNCCHVLHIIHSGIPKRLQCLLEDPTSVKVGVAVAGDAAKLLRDHNVSINALEDLSTLADRKLGGDQRKWKWSLSSLTETLIFRKLPKPNMIRLGNWEVEALSKEQLNYAATDAYISWYLYQVLKNLPDLVENNQVETEAAPN
ncbi:hypothetical protein BUALT_Bualt14G0031200 [Buddleja alternifolia]|uniref:3'-5' exonuclease n=1 Tax=Buddleja alternifolia TaxID=168488 RepID=A0AAV6WMP9_9LAMI|nr:hypothetical protein BUALT_Bualt14G0031200 [Buddleja alternifolia]